MVMVVGLVVFNGGVLSGTTAATAAGWMMPVAAGITAAGVAWALTRPREEEPDERQHALAGCAACGGTVFDEWRLCPHCGALLEDERDRTRTA